MKSRYFDKQQKIFSTEVVILTRETALGIKISLRNQFKGFKVNETKIIYEGTLTRRILLENLASFEFDHR